MKPDRERDQFYPSMNAELSHAAVAAILAYRYGWVISRQRVQQIEAVALAKMREAMDSDKKLGNIFQ